MLTHNDKILLFDDVLEALETLTNDVKNRQRQHRCPGFDCSICTLVEALSLAESVLDKAKRKQP
jgi:hypothetical protein